MIDSRSSMPPSTTAIVVSISPIAYHQETVNIERKRSQVQMSAIKHRHSLALLRLNALEIGLDYLSRDLSSLLHVECFPDIVGTEMFIYLFTTSEHVK